jgi:hypothetical protein
MDRSRSYRICNLVSHGYGSGPTFAFSQDMMKTTMLAMTSLVGLGSVASAEPSIETTATNPTDSGRYYGQLGATLGVDSNLFLFQALTLEGGARLGASPFWVHGSGAMGVGSELLGENVRSSYVSLRAGIEARACMVSAFCAFTGVDAGFRHESLMSDDEMIDANDAVAYPRFGVDIGTKQIRLRQTVEASITGRGMDGIATTLSVAHYW